MKKVYNKLVRDLIPEIIKANGENPITRILESSEYKIELEKKLREECEEVLGAVNSKARIEELADVYEILSALAKLENSSIDEVALVAKAKADKRGAFDKKVYLEEVEENEQ